MRNFIIFGNIKIKQQKHLVKVLLLLSRVPPGLRLDELFADLQACLNCDND